MTISNKYKFQYSSTISILKIHPKCLPLSCYRHKTCLGLTKRCLQGPCHRHIDTHHPKCVLCDSWVLWSSMRSIPTIDLHCVTLDFFDPSLAFDSHHPNLCCMTMEFYDTSLACLLIVVFHEKKIKKKSQIKSMIVMELIQPSELNPHTLVCCITYVREEFRMTPRAQLGFRNVFHTSLRVAF